MLFRLANRGIGCVFASTLAFAALLSLPGAAEAQQPAPAAVPAAPSAAVAEPPASQLAAARELVVASGMSRSFTILIPQFMDQLGTALTQTRPELIRDLNVVMEQLKPEFDKQADEMIDLAAHIYTRLMTEQELKAATAFFNSDAGRKYVATQPLFMNDALTAMQGWQAKISSNMVTRVRAEMKKKGHDL